MNNKLRNLLSILSIITICSCIKQISLTEKERSYILLPEELPKELLINKSTIQYKKGSNYNLLYSKSLFNEPGILFNVDFIDVNNTKANYRYSVDVFSSDSRAREFFKGQGITSTLLFNKYILNLDNNIYESDEIACVEKEDYFLLVIRRRNYVILITSVNIAIRESHLRPILKAKIKHLNDLVRKNRL